MSLLKSIGDKLKEIGEDFANLDVLTLTGEVEIKSKKAAGSSTAKALSLSETYKALAGLAVDGKMTVVALTHVDLDADSVNFVKSDLTPDEMSLIEAHKAAVASAQETRKGLVDMARALVGAVT